MSVCRTCGAHGLLMQFFLMFKSFPIFISFLSSMMEVKAAYHAWVYRRFPIQALLLFGMVAASGTPWPSPGYHASLWLLFNVKLLLFY